jgi:hypothetical protein
LEAIATHGVLTDICTGVSVISVLIVTLFNPVGGVHEAIATGRELTGASIDGVIRTSICVDLISVIAGLARLEESIATGWIGTCVCTRVGVILVAIIAVFTRLDKTVSA